MARKQAFSDATILNLSAGKLSDPLTDGLAIEANGENRTWRYYRRVAGNGNLVRMTLGTYPAYSIKDARQWAETLNEQVERGIDPKAAERAAKAAANALAMTLAQAHALYLADAKAGVRRQLKPRTLADKLAIWSRDIEPNLGQMALASIAGDDLWRIVEAKGDTAPVRANRLAGELKVMFGWFMSRAGQRAGIRLTLDPSATLSAHHYAESAGRTRILSDEEIGWFVQACNAEQPAYRRAFLLLLLTGCRFAEVVEAPTDEFCDGIWTIAASRSKNGTSHSIALGQLGRSLFNEAKGQWLAPSRTGGLVQHRNWYRVRDRIHARMEKAAGRPIAGWGPHDLRRTLRSNTFRLGIPFEVAEAMLNHVRKGLERRYDIGDLSGFTADAFARWEAHVAKVSCDDVWRDIGGN
jgi:integrase